jgi:hypothetical protein
MPPKRLYGPDITFFKKGVTSMSYFNAKNIASIAICAALWGVLNTILSPVFFRMFGMPFLCDLIGFTVLILATWWIRKFGAITMIGLITTGINFALGGGIQFLGFTAASIFFDLSTLLIGYNRTFKKPAFTSASMMSISVASAALAGYIIGSLFMTTPALANWGGVLGWAGLHAIGGVLGGIIGVFLITALHNRKILQPDGIEIYQKDGTFS